MQTYLAEKYMSGPKADAILAKTALTKKKKRKAAAPLTSVGYGAMIVDDDGGWGKDNKEDEDDIADAVVASDRSFKKRKAESSKTGAGGSSGWMTIRDGAGPESPPPGEDEQPQVVDEPFKGGLVTSAQLKKVLPQKGKEKKREETEEEREEARLAQETIYRDASGQRIDIKAERAEAARKKREREEQEAKKMQWGKGLVQREDEERRRQQLERESKRDLAVYADDKELNDELKAKDRWNDPAVAFIMVRH